MLLAALEASPDAVVVIVSHLPSQRRSTVASLVALAEAGHPRSSPATRSSFPVARKDVPGTYLGESIGEGARVVIRENGNGALLS